MKFLFDIRQVELVNFWDCLETVLINLRDLGELIICKLAVQSLVSFGTIALVKVINLDTLTSVRAFIIRWTRVNIVLRTIK